MSQLNKFQKACLIFSVVYPTLMFGLSEVRRQRINNIIEVSNAANREILEKTDSIKKYYYIVPKADYYVVPKKLQ